MQLHLREKHTIKKENAGRQIYLDDLRLLATIFVIGVHTVSLAATMVERGTVSFYVLEIFDFMFLSCNLLFIMLSGALLLPVQKENIGNFFIKRFARVAIPLVVYYIIYVVAKEGTQWLTPAYWRVLFLRILREPPEQAPHFWLVYTLLQLYILTPFFRWVLKHISDEVFAGMILLIFLVNGLDTYLPLLGITSPFRVVVDSYAGVYFFGYFIQAKCNKKLENLIMAGGGISMIFSCFAIILTSNYQDFIHQNAPTMMLFSATVFLLIKRLAKEQTKEGYFMKLLCKYSFSILLIHWAVLHGFVKQILQVDVLSFGIIGGCSLMIVLTLLFSLAGAIVIDNTIIRILQWIGHILSLPFIYYSQRNQTGDTA